MNDILIRVRQEKPQVLPAAFSCPNEP